MVADLNAAFLPTSCPLLVVKVGSSLLVQPDGNVRRQWLETVVADISARHKAGQRIVIVTSGAIALGARRLGFEKAAAAASPMRRPRHRLGKLCCRVSGQSYWKANHLLRRKCS